MHSELEHVRQFGDKLVAMDEMPCTDVKTIKLDGQWLSSSEIVRAAVDMERDVLKLYHDVYPLAEEYGAMFGDMSIALLLEENIEHTTADVEEMEKLITTDRLGQDLRSTLYSDR
jgi:ferritin-like protein